MSPAGSEAELLSRCFRNWLRQNPSTGGYDCSHVLASRRGWRMMLGGGPAALPQSPARSLSRHSTWGVLAAKLIGKSVSKALAAPGTCCISIQGKSGFFPPPPFGWEGVNGGEQQQLADAGQGAQGARIHHWLGSQTCLGAQVGPRPGLVPPGGRAHCEGGWRSAEEGLAWPAARPLLLLLRFEGSALGRRDRCEHCGRLTGAELLPLPSSPSPSPSVSLREATGLDFPSPWLRTAWGFCCCWLPAASPPPRHSSWTGFGAARKPQEPLWHPALGPPRPSWQRHRPPRARPQGRQHSSVTLRRGTRPPRSSTRSRTPARQCPRARRERTAPSSGTGALQASRRRQASRGRPLPPAARHPPTSPLRPRILQGRGTPMRRSRPSGRRGHGCPCRSRRLPAQVVLLSLSHQVTVPASRRRQPRTPRETEHRPRHVLQTAPARGEGDPRWPPGRPLPLQAPPRWVAGTQSTAAAKAPVAGGWRWPLQTGAGALLRPNRGQLAVWILVLLTPPVLPTLIY